MCYEKVEIESEVVLEGVGKTGGTVAKVVWILCAVVGLGWPSAVRVDPFNI